MNDDHAADVIWSKRHKRWIALCHCGFSAIGGSDQQAQVRSNLQLHLSKHRTAIKENESA